MYVSFIQFILPPIHPSIHPSISNIAIPKPISVGCRAPGQYEAAQPSSKEPRPWEPGDGQFPKGGRPVGMGLGPRPALYNGTWPCCLHSRCVCYQDQATKSSPRSQYRRDERKRDQALRALPQERRGRGGLQVGSFTVSITRVTYFNFLLSIKICFK